MAGYLITRLFFAGAFRRAEQQPETVTAPYSVPPAARVPRVETLPYAPYQGGEDDIAKIGDDIAKIKDFWKPGGGVVHPDHEKVLKTWLTKNGIDESVVSFLSKPQYTSQRAQAIRDIPIPQTETAS